MDNQTQAPLTNSGEQQIENNISPVPVNDDKSAKLKWVGVGILATLLVVGVVAAVWFGFLKKGNNQTPNQVNNQTNQNITPTPTPLPIDSNAWELALAKDEIKPSSNLVENSLIYAVKSEYTSTIYRRNLQTGSQTKILEFDEETKADKSGNLWSGLPPAIALSSDKKSLAFIDKEGLKVYDLQTKTTKTFIRVVAKGKCENCPPK